jgi:tetratricopeptide (TPR) repeat protein
MSKDSQKAKGAEGAKGESADATAEARTRLASTGRNEPCACGSGKKYKKCHLIGDEAATAPVPEAPDARKTLANAWSLFEQRRPGAAEKEFRAALALDGTLVDARVGIGLARLSANDADGAKAELATVVKESEGDFKKLRDDKVKDAFTRPEAQPMIRAAHALGCLAYDQDRFDDAFQELERVYSIDEGPVGTEARLISAKALMKQNKAAEVIAVLEPALKAETGGGRAQTAALTANGHFGKAVLGRVRRHVENVAGTQPGTVEEAVVYAQTYGDVWTDAAKKFLEQVLAEKAAEKPAAPRAEAPAAEAEATD